ncbi:MAG: hypothetical protein R2874_09875 [Desulfobacterales bacterium]
MQPDHVVTGWPGDSVYRKRQVDLAKQLFSLRISSAKTKNGPGGWSGDSGFLTRPVAIIVVTDKKCFPNPAPV